MSYMLYNCDSFDQSLAAWNIENVTNLNKIMQNATGLSTSNYNLTLVSWAHQNVNSGLAVDFGGSQYSAGGAAAASRNILTSAPITGQLVTEDLYNIFCNFATMIWTQTTTWTGDFTYVSTNTNA